MRVLVVSESPARREWVRKSLGLHWEVAEAADGREAIRAVRSRGMDLVVSDETTEPFGAFGLARELKALSEPPGVIILLERKEDVWLARWSGADRWLLDPVDPFALAEAAAEIAEQASQARPGPRQAQGGTA